jgi:predicted nucleic acid-binding protein
MNVLIDTNVVLDYLLKRQPFENDALRIFFLSERDLIRGYISASAATDIFYIVRKDFHDKEKTYAALKDLFTTVKIAAVDETTICDSLDLKWDDFEDCVQFVTARDFQADYIITRDVDGFENSEIAAISPADFIELIKLGED